MHNRNERKVTAFINGEVWETQPYVGWPLPPRIAKMLKTSFSQPKKQTEEFEVFPGMDFQDERWLKTTIALYDYLSDSFPTPEREDGFFLAEGPASDWSPLLTWPWFPSPAGSPTYDRSTYLEQVFTGSYRHPVIETGPKGGMNDRERAIAHGIGRLFYGNVNPEKGNVWRFNLDTSPGLPHGRPDAFYRTWLLGHWEENVDQFAPMFEEWDIAGTLPLGFFPGFRAGSRFQNDRMVKEKDEKGKETGWLIPKARSGDSLFDQRFVELDKRVPDDAFKKRKNVAKAYADRKVRPSTKRNRPIFVAPAPGEVPGARVGAANMEARKEACTHRDSNGRIVKVVLFGQVETGDYDGVLEDACAVSFGDLTQADNAYTPGLLEIFLDEYFACYNPWVKELQALAYSQPVIVSSDSMNQAGYGISGPLFWLMNKRESKRCRSLTKNTSGTRPTSEAATFYGANVGFNMLWDMTHGRPEEPKAPPPLECLAAYKDVPASQFVAVTVAAMKTGAYPIEMILVGDGVGFILRKSARRDKKAFLEWPNWSPRIGVYQDDGTIQGYMAIRAGGRQYFARRHDTPVLGVYCNEYPVNSPKREYWPLGIEVVESLSDTQAYKTMWGGIHHLTRENVGSDWKEQSRLNYRTPPGYAAINMADRMFMHKREMVHYIAGLIGKVSPELLATVFLSRHASELPNLERYIWRGKKKEF